jgi:hypothetical protein
MARDFGDFGTLSFKVKEATHQLFFKEHSSKKSEFPEHRTLFVANIPSFFKVLNCPRAQPLQDDSLKDLFSFAPGVESVKFDPWVDCMKVIVGELCCNPRLVLVTLFFKILLL